MTPSLLSASAAIAAVVLVVVGVTIPLAKFKGKNAAKIRPSKEPKANP
jgi:fumarate reductase subunit D